MSQSINLHWAPLQSMAPGSVSHDINKRPGIYIWGFDLRDVREERMANVTDRPLPYLKDLTWQFIPYYVGIASNLMQRITDHAKNVTEGKYRVYHWDHLHNFAIHERAPSAGESDPTDWKVYPNSPEARQHFNTVVYEDAKKMLQAMRFTYAIPDDGKVWNDDTRRRIEALMCRKLDGFKHHEAREVHCDGISITHSGDEVVVGALEIVRRHAAVFNEETDLSWSL